MFKTIGNRQAKTEKKWQKLDQFSLKILTTLPQWIGETLLRHPLTHDLGLYCRNAGKKSLSIESGVSSSWTIVLQILILYVILN